MKNEKILTMEELQEQFKQNQKKQQNEFAEKVLNDIRWWNEKANRKGYNPTLEEQAAFVEILQIVNGMNETGLMNHIPD